MNEKIEEIATAEMKTKAETTMSIQIQPQTHIQRQDGNLPVSEKQEAKNDQTSSKQISTSEKEKLLLRK